MFSTETTGDSPSVQDSTPQDSDLELDWADDPRNPYNWSELKRLYHTAIVSLYAFTITYMSSAYAQGAKETAASFGISTTVSLLGVSLFCVGLGLGPVMGAPLSETVGRLWVFRMSMPIAALFLIGAAVANNFATMAICRFFAGVFGSPALSVGGGTMADIWPLSRRGPATGFFLLAPFLGPCIAPIIGGFVIERLDWRWLEWVSVFWAVATCLFAIGMEETYKKKILERDSKEKKVANTPRLSASVLQKWARDSLLRPLEMIVTEPIILFLSLYVGFNFAVLYAFFASIPLVFEKTYGFGSHQNGLVFVSLGIGACLATVTGILCDKFIYQKRHKEVQNKGEPGNLPPEQRLQPAMMGSVGVVVGLFWFAWSARSDIHWISPVLALIPFNWGNLCVFSSNALYVVDCYGSRFGASALSANAFVRYGFAAAFPLFTIQMYERLTIPWAGSLLGFFSLVLVPIPWVLYIFGPSIRKRSRYT